VIIPCFNGENYIQNCLRSIELTRGPSKEVIVVDNGSTDNSLDLVKPFKVKIIQNRQNVGFPRAINQAAAQAHGDFLVALNQDTEVHPDWLNELRSIFRQDSRVGICGPRVLDLTDRYNIQQIGVSVDRFGFSMYNKHQPEMPQEVFMVSGAAMMVRHSLFDLVGGFDSDYFLFEDDLDLCWRIHLVGYKVVVNPHAIVYHYGGSAMKGGFPSGPGYSTTRARRYFSERNTLQTLLKNYELHSIARVMFPYVGMNFLEILFFIAIGKMEGAIADLMSLHYNLAHFRNIWKKHAIVKKLRCLNDSELSLLLERRNLKLLAFRKWGAPSFERPDEEFRPPG